MSDSLQHLREHGFVILPGVLSRPTVETLRAELQPHLGPFGRNPFEGERTQRAYALLGYGLMGNSFMGYVDGRNPRKLVEAAARRQARDTDAPER